MPPAPPPSHAPPQTPPHGMKQTYAATHYEAKPPPSQPPPLLPPCKATLDTGEIAPRLPRPFPKSRKSPCAPKYCSAESAKFEHRTLPCPAPKARLKPPNPASGAFVKNRQKDIASGAQSNHSRSSAPLRRIPSLKSKNHATPSLKVRCKWRRERDSNPRCLAAHLISSQAHSATLSSLLVHGLFTKSC